MQTVELLADNEEQRDVWMMALLAYVNIIINNNAEL